MEEFEKQILDFVNRTLEERKKLLESGWSELSNTIKKALDSFALHLKVDFAPLSPDKIKEISLPKIEAQAKVSPAIGDFSSLLLTIKRMREETSQGRLISHLLDALSKVTKRVALFVIKEEKMVGWDGRGFQNLSEMDFRKITLPLVSESIFSRVVKDAGIYHGPFPILKGDNRILSFLGGEPAEILIVPVIVRGKVSGIIYADEYPEKRGIKNPEIIEILVDFAEAMVELLPVKSKYKVKPKERIKLEPPSLQETKKEKVVFAPPAGISHPFAPEDTRPGISPEVVELEEEAEELEIPSANIPSQVSPEWGEEEIEIEMEEEVIPDEEKPLHEAAKRKARVLVSDLILYNREKIEEAKKKGNIYKELKDEIDLAIEIYRKKVGSKISKDYLYKELLEKVADGDPSLLEGYPGV